MRAYRFVRDTSFRKLEALHELQTGSPLPQNENLVLADPPYRIRSARGQTKSADDVFCKDDTEDAMRFLRDLMASGAHSHTFFPQVMSFFRKKSIRWQAVVVEIVVAGLERSREQRLHFFGKEDQDLIYTRSFEVNSSHPRRRDLLHVLLSETGIYYWRNGL